jgi:hypothetical protein
MEITHQPTKSIGENDSFSAHTMMTQRANVTINQISTLHYIKHTHGCVMLFDCGILSVISASEGM